MFIRVKDEHVFSLSWLPSDKQCETIEGIEIIIDYFLKIEKY